MANVNTSLVSTKARFSTIPIKFHEETSGKTISVEADVGKTLLDISIGL